MAQPDLSQPQAAIRAGDLAGARASLFDLVRKFPEASSLRVFLFELCAVLGEWDRAKNQLKVCGEMEPTTLNFTSLYAAAIDAEAVRGEVMAGNAAPDVFGEPGAWIAMMIEALRLDGQGHADAARALRADALGQAPASGGTLNDTAFEWVADADSRLGPILEAVLDGQYHWVPVSTISKLEIEAPSDLRDMVWTPATLTIHNGGQFAILIPSRYPLADSEDDAELRLARRTEWEDLGEGQYRGQGQRMIATDSDDTALFDLRTLEITGTSVETV